MTKSVNPNITIVAVDKRPFLRKLSHALLITRFRLVKNIEVMKIQTTNDTRATKFLINLIDLITLIND